MYLIALIFLQSCILQVIVSYPAPPTAKVRGRALDETFYMTDELRDKYKSLLADRSGDKYTEWNSESDPEFSFNVTSTCPWKYVLYYNPNRIPETHIEAMCLTQTCFNLTTEHASYKALSQNENFQRDSICTPIKYARWVKVKHPPKKQLLLVNVGCSCSHNRSIIM